MATADLPLSSHQVDIFYNLDQNPNPICAGTLISSYLILTVYSCLVGKNETKLKVRASARPGATRSSQIRNVDLIQNSPALRSDPKENDLAVIVLTSSFHLDDSFNSIKINEHDIKDIELEGSTFLSQCRGKNTQSKSKCTTDVKNGSTGWICIPKLKSTLGDEQSAPGCPLPLLGSGLLCEIRGIYVLCGTLAKNGVDGQIYTDISKHLHWIRPTFEMRPGGICDDDDCFVVKPELEPTNFKGRTVSSPSSIPYQLSLQRRGEKGEWEHICGAVIIDRKTGLSAAHCFEGGFKLSAYRVVAGATRLAPDSDSDSDTSTRQILPLKRIIRHQNFRTVFNGDDIAVIHVNGSFSFNANVGNIWIPPPSETRSAGLLGRVSGWGQISTSNGALSNSLQEVDMRILSDAECQEVWWFHKPSMLCSYHNTSNTCAGDSGGPLVVKNYQLQSNTKRNKGRDALVGISSFSHNDCDRAMEPNGFTRVSWFYNWINENQASKCSSKCRFQIEDSDFDERSYEFRAVSSLFFRPGSDYKVFFTVLPLTSSFSRPVPLRLKCILMANSSQSTTIESDPLSLLPGESGQISIPLPREMPGNESVWRLFAWSFTKQSQGDEYKFDAPHTLIFSSQTNSYRQSVAKVDLASVFIQTDKPAYKQRDLVRIRVVTMGTNDLPHSTAGVNMTIIDNLGKVMKKWEQPFEIPESASVSSNASTNGNGNVTLFGEFQKKKNGLSSYNYQLSGDPILGSWTIEVEAGNIKERMYFDVQKFILPKFKVKVNVPPVLYGNGESSTLATVQVSYTNGKSLEGTGNLTAYSNYNGRTKITQIVVKDGEASVPLKLSGSRAYSTFHTITANVTENNTGRWQIGSATVQIFPQETYNIEWIHKPYFYKPGLSITVQLKITGQDKLPVKELRPNALRITFPSLLNLPAKEAPIPLSGIVTFTFPTPLEPLPANSKFRAHYKTTTHDFVLPGAARGTSSGIFIQVFPPRDATSLVQGNSYNFTIRSNKPIQPKVFHALFWNDAALDVFGAQTIINNLREPTVELPFSLRIPKAAYTNLQLFVYFEYKDNEGGSPEIISASKLIHTENYLKIRVSRTIQIKAPKINNSNLVPTTTAPVQATTEDYYDYQDDDPGVAEEQASKTSSKLEVEPGADVEIHFETYPDSLIAIRGIDQSLFLLTEQGQDNELTQEKVENKRTSSQSFQSHLDDIPTDSSSFLRTFHRLGISVLNSKRFTTFLDLGATSAGGNLLEEGEIGVAENAVFDYSRFSQVDSRLRTKFPETWLWEEFQSSTNSSTTTLSKILPDTLTSWIISGFSLNPNTGLGVASPVTITGFMPFFVTLNLPHSVIKYEYFDLQVIVHNHMDRDVDVFVTLFNRQKGFEFIDSRDNQRGNKTHSLRVKKDHATLTHFVIMPMVFGDIPIEVSTVTEDGTAGDSMIRPLKVTSDGVRQTRTQTVIFSRQEAAHVNLTRDESLRVEFPKRVVKGASSLQLTVTTDLRTIQNVRDEDELQLNIRASSNSPTVNTSDTELSVTVTRWNRIVLQEFTLPASTKVVTVTATGSGSALIQMTETWYISISNRPTEPQDFFNITAKMTIPDLDEPSETELRVCVNSYHVNGTRDTIASIELPSGYTFYPEDFEADSKFMAKIPKTVLRFELSQGNTKMDVYYSEIKAYPPTCISLPAPRLIEVANAKKPTIHVYEYLNPERKASIVYEPAHKITQCQLCRITGACGTEECD